MTQARATDPLLDFTTKDSVQFDWTTEDCVVLSKQPRTAVYVNSYGAVVIRQEGEGSDDDNFLTFGTAESVRILIAALEREIRGAP